MNLASANTVGGASSTFVTARGAYDKVSGVETRNPETEDQVGDRSAEPLTGRYPIVAFSYNSEASRLIMLFRDPASGEAIKQIPTETVVKQYEEAQFERRKAERRGDFEVVVDGAKSETRGGAPGNSGDDAAQGYVGAVGVTAQLSQPVGGTSGPTVGATAFGGVSGGSSGFGSSAGVSVGGSGVSSGGSTSVNVVI